VDVDGSFEKNICARTPKAGVVLNLYSLAASPTSTSLAIKIQREAPLGWTCMCMVSWRLGVRTLPACLVLMATDVAVMGEGTVILGKYTYLTLPPLNATHTWEPLSIN
jgi:hypothetical protein